MTEIQRKCYLKMLEWYKWAVANDVIISNTKADAEYRETRYRICLSTSDDQLEEMIKAYEKQINLMMLSKMSRNL